jgi:predicted Zn-dependent protease
MPPIRIEPITLTSDKYRHEFKSKATKVVLLLAFWCPFGFGIAWILGFTGTTRLLLGMGLAVPLAAAAFLAIRFAQRAGSGVVLTFLGANNGSGSPRAITSHAESLAARGRYDEATAEFAALRAAYPHDIALRRTEAEFQAGVGGNPQIAAQVLNELRRVPNLPGPVERYATHRLLDLYLGVLADPGRAMVELRRMADRFPDTPDGQGALAELRRRREHLAQDQTQT